VEQVEQITFSGEYAQSVSQSVLCVTERAVFELTDEGVVLTEIAPGIDLERDILARMGFKPIISRELRIMDAKIFSPGPMYAVSDALRAESVRGPW
jgi:propionate CoA-transferase